MYMVKIDDRIAMYPEKMTGDPAALEVFHGLPNQMSHRSSMKSNMVSERLQPQNIFDPYQNDLLAALSGHSS